MGIGLLTNREIATLVLLGAFAVVVFARPQRGEPLRAARGVLASLMTPKRAIPLLLYFAWIVVAVLIAESVGVWDSALLKPLTLWVLFSGFGLVLNLNDAMRKPRFFRSAMRKTIGAGAAVEFLATLKSFPIWLELPAQSFVFLFAGVAAVASHDRNSSTGREVAVAFPVIYGLSALVWSGAHVLSDWRGVVWGTLVREFLMPVWLTPAALLFVYVFALIATYEQAFVRMRLQSGSRVPLRQKVAMILVANARLGIVRLCVPGVAACRLANARGFRETQLEIGHLRQEDRLRLRRSAGMSSLT